MWGRQVPVEGEADGARSEPLSRQTGISSVTKCFRNIHALLLVALLHPALSISLLLRNPILKTVFTSTCSFNAPFHHFGTFWQLPMMSWASIYFLMSLALVSLLSTLTSSNMFFSFLSLSFVGSIWQFKLEGISHCLLSNLCPKHAQLWGQTQHCLGLFSCLVLKTQGLSQHKISGQPVPQFDHPKLLLIFS